MPRLTSPFPLLTATFWLLMALLILGLLPLTLGPSRPASARPPTLPSRQTPEPSPQRAFATYGQLPLPFEANQGQTDPQVRFLARGPAYTLFLTPTAAVLALYHPARPAARPTASSTSSASSASSAFNPVAPATGEEDTAALTVLRMKLLGANPRPEVSGLEELPGTSHYFLGNDPTKWHTHIPHYARVRHADVYPGIDLIFYGLPRPAPTLSGRSLPAQAGPRGDPELVPRLSLGTVSESRTAERVAGLPRRSPQGEGAGPQPAPSASFTPSAVEGSASPATTTFNPVAPATGLEFDFIVHPGADPNAIRLAFDGADKLTLDPQGNLLLHLGGTGVSPVELLLHKPRIYQELDGVRQPELRATAHGPAPTKPAGRSRGSRVTSHELQISGRYVLKGKHQVGFQVAPYDATQPLIIDPVVIFSTYLGGSGEELGWDLALDSDGNTYVTGRTFSTDFPTANPSQPANAGGSDIFVTKLNASGDTLVYSTYLGGSGGEEGRAIAVDASGNAYVTGFTESTDFPTANPIQATFGGGARDAFVLKLNASGAPLVYSTYLGGSDFDQGLDIAVDATGNAYLTGFTRAADFPTANPFQPLHAGERDAFVTKLNPTGTTLLYSTYLGGSNSETGLGIALDAARNAYVTGNTASATDFPITALSFQPIFGGVSDAFITKLTAAGDALLYSTYLGGTDSDSGEAITVDADGNAYSTGATSSSDFPTANPFQAAPAGAGDAFVTKLNPAGDTLVFSTYLGGSGSDQGFAIALDTSRNVYVTGRTASSDFPTNLPVQSTFQGGSDIIIARLNRLGNILVFSTYFGRSSFEQGRGIAVDPTLNVYVAGSTNSDEFPTLVPLQAARGGAFDAFILRMGTGPGNPVPTLTSLSPATVPAGVPDFTLTLTGIDFLSDSVVRWNGSDRTTTFVSSTALEATIPASDLDSGGMASVTVFNPPAGGGSSNTLDFTIADFTVAVSPASATVIPGQSATYTVTLSPQFGSFDGRISLSCSDLPARTSCRFSRPRLTPATNVVSSTLTASTTPPSAIFTRAFDPPLYAHAPARPGLTHTAPPGSFAFVLPGLALVGIALLGQKRRKSRLGFYLALAFLLAFLTLQAACGGAIRDLFPTGTPTGTHSFTITGTAGSIERSTTATLIVQ